MPRLKKYLAYLAPLPLLPIALSFLSSPARPVAAQISGPIPLQPSASAQVIVPNFTIENLDEGSRKLSMHVGDVSPGTSFAFHYEVNTITHVYTTTATTPEPFIPLQDTVANPDPEAHSTSARPITISTTLPRVSFPIARRGVSPLGANCLQGVPEYTTFRIQVSQIAQDIVGFDLVRTLNFLRWRLKCRDPGTRPTVQWRNHQAACFAAFPTPIGTHWFIDSCPDLTPQIMSSEREVWKDALSHFHNFDFGDINLITEVFQESHVIGKLDGKTDVTTVYIDRGESDLTIFGTQSITSETEPF